MDMVDYLLERGAAPNPSAVAHTALRAASIFGHELVARRLLEAQADPNMSRWVHSLRAFCARASPRIRPSVLPSMHLSVHASVRPCTYVSAGHNADGFWLSACHHHTSARHLISAPAYSEGPR